MGEERNRRRIPVVSTALEVHKRYTADAADPLAAAIGFFGFLSLFPLILLAVSVAGFVLDDPDDQVAVADVITESIPGFDAAVGQDGDETAVADLVTGAVGRRGTIGAIGLALVLMSGLRVVAAAMTASRVVFRSEVMSGVAARLRQVVALVGLGTTALLAAAASSFAGIGLEWLPGRVTLPVSTGVTFVLDVALFLGAYTLLAPRALLSVRERIPGALLAAAGWTILKIVGATYVARQVENANAVYGALGGVIGLLLLLYLAGRLYLYGAELSAVLAERRRGPLAESASTLSLLDGSPPPAIGRDTAPGEATGRATSSAPPAASGHAMSAAPAAASGAGTVGLVRAPSAVPRPASTTSSGQRDRRPAFALGATMGAVAVALGVLGRRR